MARPRSEEARRRVIEATVESLLAVGVEGTTIEEVADRSGVARSTIYRHFGAREKLIVEAVRSCLVEHPTPDSGSLDADLHELIGRFDHEENRTGNELLPLLLDERRRDETMAAAVQVLLEERRRPIRTVLKLAQLRGEIDPDLDLEFALAMLLGPLTYRRMVQDEAITEEFVSTALPGAIAALRSTSRRAPQASA
jgi:AcrR family transcriptional regulator